MSLRNVSGRTTPKAWMPAAAAVAGAVALAVAVCAAGGALAAEPNAPIRASSIHPGTYLPEYAVDGDPNTRWASGPCGDQPEWVQIDFGKTVPVRSVVIHWETAHATRYRVEMSDDGRAWRTLREVQGAKGGAETLAGLSGQGRYFRVLCLRPSAWKLYSIWEIEFPDREAAEALTSTRQIAAQTRRQASDEAGQLLKNLVADYGVKEIVFALRQPGKDGHWYANFSYWSHTEGPLYGPGGKLCRLDLPSGQVTVLLDDQGGGVRDPVVDYDARKVLFSYRKGTSPYYHLYEMDLDGGGRAAANAPVTNPAGSPASPPSKPAALRQLTDGPYDDIEPCYLPNGRIVFVSTRCKRWVNCWLTKVAVMYTCDADGRNMRPISANLEQDNTPWPLPDGRILYQRWEYVDRSQVDYHHLWTSNPDGTGQMVYYGNQHPGTVMIDAKPIPATDKVVAIFSPGHGQREHDGTITVVDVQDGPDDRRGAHPITPTASYRDPWAFSENLFLAVQGGRRIVLLDAAGHSSEIYRVSRGDAAAGLECHEPRPMIRRPRETVLPDRTDLQRTTGTLVLADVYKGRNMAGVRPGEIKKLLVLESLPKPVNFTGGMDPLTYGGSFTLERVLGTVPVEPDGSACMELPALRALFFVALDANDLAVKRMQSFLTVEPGETTGCVGCHEQRTQTYRPPGNTMATRQPPRHIEPIADCPDVFDFPRDIQPILDKLCLDCHDYRKTARGGPYAGHVVLSGDHGPMFSHAYFTMTVRRLFVDNHNQARSNYPPRSLGSSASRILTMLDGAHYGVRADAHQKKVLRLWTEVGAPYPGTYAALGGGSVGGYIANSLVNTDFDWPTTRAGAEVIDRRCAACHRGAKVLPRSLSDERGVSFWSFSLDDPLLKLSRHVVFNLTRPEDSLLVLAPLAERAGGLGLCRDKQGKAATVFGDTADPDYRTLLAMVAAGKRNLDKIKRFDMPGFEPLPQYLREMKHYGILPADFPTGAPVDPYELDRRYWQSLWYRPPAAP